DAIGAREHSTATATAIRIAGRRSTGATTARNQITDRCDPAWPSPRKRPDRRKDVDNRRRGRGGAVITRRRADEDRRENPTVSVQDFEDDVVVGDFELPMCFAGSWCAWPGQAGDEA